MEIILNVEGMMCSGCENRVENSLKSIDGVTDVVASHTNKTVIVKTNGNVSKETLKEVVEDIGYEVKE